MSDEFAKRKAQKIAELTLKQKAYEVAAMAAHNRGDVLAAHQYYHTPPMLHTTN